MPPRGRSQDRRADDARSHKATDRRMAFRERRRRGPERAHSDVPERGPEPATQPWSAGRRSVLVGTEGVRRRAGVADRGGCVERAKGDGHAAVGEEALDVIEAFGPALELDQATECAPLDALRGEPIRIWLDRYRRKGQCHGGGHASRAFRAGKTRSGGGL